MPVDLSETRELRQFNREVIAQALALVRYHLNGDVAAYGCPVGAHLRHVIEHYDALRAAGAGAAVDYDGRPRDRQLEHCPQTALQRLLALDDWLADSGAAALDAPLRVLGCAGLGGQQAFSVTSTLGRELVFVGGHAVHHFALLKHHCQRHGIPVDPDFGKAPATVAHERAGPPAATGRCPSPGVRPSSGRSDVRAQLPSVHPEARSATVNPVNAPGRPRTREQTAPTTPSRNDHAPV
jgi:hypothetical protein